MGTSPPRALKVLVGRYDRATFEPQGGAARLRLAVAGGDAWDALLDGGEARLDRPRGNADATLTADSRTWAAIADDVGGGIRAFRSGRLEVRRNLHVGVGFLAATSGVSGPGHLRFRTVVTRRARLSTLEAGIGPPVLAIHGLGATKGSFVFSVAALAARFRVVAVDLPGFGDSDKPIGAAYNPPVLRRRDDRPAGRARARPGGSDRQQPRRRGAGGRPPRSRPRRWAPALRLVRPELGLVQLAPRAVVHRLIPGANEGWTAAGVDEFARAYLTPPGRAAFYAAARHIYLEAPHGTDGFWSRLPELQPDALFIWGRRDTLVPIAFARHVSEALPQARHAELDCGHVPQMERPVQTHKAVAAFLSE